MKRESIHLGDLEIRVAELDESSGATTVKVYTHKVDGGRVGCAFRLSEESLRDPLVGLYHLTAALQAITKRLEETDGTDNKVLEAIEACELVCASNEG